MFGISKLLCTAAGLLYPVYCSFYALKSPSPHDDSQWLTYWIVHAFISTAESFIPFVGWIPLYYEFKLVLTIWMVAPATKGALFLYQRFIEPFLNKNAHKIEPFVKVAEKAMDNPAIAAFGKLVEAHGEDAAKSAGALIQKIIDEHGDKAVEMLRQMAQEAQKVAKESKKST